ncbi:hypothetical protein STSP2_01038 [Anaerohalosphaera lusitana]|uniref:LamG-like jellyroll fold domain-containing protein n=1 Tax=Anaerohalosphaera lusitana TaxID=1936003 RepID=A0A1U9NK46_9BACT|nr:hypothetical protein [Anaerohalosphaera lusitana]AQT67886.1 hypothetical protein STSP2_01038 [Anaerohalosphaera lusitana]
MKKFFGVLLCLVFVSAANASLVGLWDFDDPANTTEATIGADLTLVGTDTAMTGYSGTDGAVSIGVGSYYEADHGITPAAGEGYVNEWSLLIDFKYPTLDWICFFQTNPSNTNDGDCFVRGGGGVPSSLGVSATGYTTNPTETETWYRMLVTVDNGEFYRIYVNGELWLDGTVQSVDGRLSLDPILLLFADENGEDNEIHVSNVAIWDTGLDSATVLELGGVGDPIGHVVGSTSLSELTMLENDAVASEVDVQFTGTAPTADVQITVDPNTVLGNADDVQLIAPGAATAGLPGEPVTFTIPAANWQQVQTIGVEPVNDSDVESTEKIGLRFELASVDAGYDGGLIPAVTVTLYDDDSAYLFIQPTSQEVIEGGSSVTCSVELTGDPTSDVEVYVSDVADPNVVAIEPEVLTFTPSNASTPQTITITAVDDDVLIATEYSTEIAFDASSSDLSFDGIPIKTVEVTIFDNECGAWGFDPVDMNQDCEVDLDDFAILASSWLKCSMPFMEDCTNYNQ